MRWMLVMLGGCLVASTACSGDDAQTEDTGAGSTGDSTGLDSTGEPEDSSSGAVSTTGGSDSGGSSSAGTSETGVTTQGDTSGTDTTGGSGVCADDPIPGFMSGTAIRWGDIPPDPTGGESDVATTDDPGMDPDAILVRVSSLATSCDGNDGPCREGWGISFTLPPEAQEPGAYMLDDFTSGYSLTLCDGGGGGGGGLGGTVEIVSIDDEEIVGRFCGTEAFDFESNGEWTAQRCP